jgi:hypothetical protein
MGGDFKDLRARGLFPHCRLGGLHVQAITERLQRAYREVELDTRLSSLDQRNPLARHPDLRGEFAL